MSRVCEICGKKTAAGRSIARRGLAKSKGGVGKKTTGITNRPFKPNIQKIRVTMDGTTKRLKICTQCMRQPNFTKPSLANKQKKSS